ncbi:lipocalin-like domain-containing protein [Saccharicrinis sp. FJH2]|uniref:lipocalin-like domain-containing protein n=1 Tax=Saccharicrinis sp. FJH65 TaxID=3344659 RepID=UPI0035F238F0
MRIKKLTTSVLVTVLIFLCVKATAADTLTISEITTLYNTYFNAGSYHYVSVHDPSVVVGYKTGSTISGEYSADASEVYYIFGSHRAWANSTDLKNWSTFRNNINNSYTTMFAAPAAWSAKGSDSYNVSGNMWAPDVIWNKDMQKWCMYMSINGENWYSSIVLLTATTLDGNWTYVGPVVYSGFTNQSEAAETDFYDVINPSEGFPSRYNIVRNGNHTYGVNAIDPCVFYDEDGNLWMSYGSWFGGIYMLRLDAETGLRDYAYTYTTNDGTAANAVSDEYQGIKVAGGNHVSGEGSYIQYINDTYYLFMSNGGLTAAGGYNMRVFASDQATGPYVDMTGQDARYSSTNTGVGKVNGQVGLRLMSYYKWGWMDDGYTAQGHNSAFTDENGKSYLVYHTRFDNGTEGHQVRVHQLFQTKNGYITAAPFEYAGETLATEPYSANDVAGSYSILYHGSGTDYANLECVTEKEIKLNSDGSVTGAYTGSWSQASDGPYITISINNVTFQGVLLTQKMEGLDYSTLCFTAVGNDISIWGYKMAGEGKPFPEDATVAYNVMNMNGTVPSEAYSGSQISLPTEGYYGATYAWKWDTTLISSEGVVKDLTSNTSTVLTLTITCGNYVYTRTSPIQLSANNIADILPIEEGAILESYADIGEYNAAAPSSRINSQTGMSLSFYLDNITSDWELIAHSTDNIYSLFLSVLRYNSADFYEAKATLSSAAISAGYSSSTAWRIFLNTSCYVTVSYNTDETIAYYKDGVLMLTFPASVTPSYGSGTTPAEIVSAVISYYRNQKLIFDYDVKNIVLGYAADLDLSTYEPVDLSDYVFYEDYDYAGLASSWITPNGSISSLYDLSLESNYIELNTNGGTGNRSALNTFSGVSGLTSYNFSFDVQLTPGNVIDRSVSEVALISTDNNNSNNSTTNSGFIFRLVTPTYNGSNGSIWYVNGSASSALSIASGTWITISGKVDVTAKTVDVTIINRSTGNSIYNGTTAVNGNGILMGLWILAGRGTGTVGIDNIKVKNGTSTGIGNVSITAGIDYNAVSEVYNLSGIRVAHGRLSYISLPTGVYIVRQGKGVFKISVTKRQ